MQLFHRFQNEMFNLLIYALFSAKQIFKFTRHNYYKINVDVQLLLSFSFSSHQKFVHFLFLLLTFE